MGLTNMSSTAKEAFPAPLKRAITNPRVLLDPTSLNGNFDCVTWSTGVDFDLQVWAGLQDLLNGKFWRLTFQVKSEDCSGLSGDFTAAVSGSRLGIVYTVHVTEEFTLEALPDRSVVSF